MTGTASQRSPSSLGVLGGRGGQLGAAQPHSLVSVPAPGLTPTTRTPSIILCPSLLPSSTTPSVFVSPVRGAVLPSPTFVSFKVPSMFGPPSYTPSTLPYSPSSSSSILTPNRLSLPLCLTQPSANMTRRSSPPPPSDSACRSATDIFHGTPSSSSSSSSPSAATLPFSNTMTSTSTSSCPYSSSTVSLPRPPRFSSSGQPSSNLCTKSGPILTVSTNDLLPSYPNPPPFPPPSSPAYSSSSVSSSTVSSSTVSSSTVSSASSATDCSSEGLPGSFMARQVVSAGVVSLTQLGMGAMEGFSSVTQHKLTDSASEDLFLNVGEYSLFSSVTYLGGMGGCLLSGFFMSKWGHRRTLLLSLPFVLLAWLCLSFANSVPLLLGARGTLGFALGFINPIASLYVMEFAHSNYRGALSSSADLIRQCGYLFIYALGSSTLSWRHLALVCGLVTTVPPFIGIFFLWDSPRWLVLNGRKEEALQSLTFFRGRGYDATAELSEIVLNIEGTNSNDDNNNTPKKKDGKSRLGSSSSSLSSSSSSSSSSLCSQFSVLRDTSVLRRCLVLAVLMFAVQFTGNTTVASYTVDIFRDAGAGVDVHLSTILTGLIRVAGSVLLVFTVDRARRRVLFVASLLVCSVCMAVLGGYFYVKEDPEIFQNVFWLPLLAVLVFTLSVIYVTSLAGLFRNEILPNNFRSLGGSLLSILVFTGAFAVPHSYYKLKDALNNYGVFWFYACCSVLTVLIPVLWLPETKGRSLEEIDEFFRWSSKGGPPTKGALVSK
ncbi:facilitated trehalose transporter Tret1-like [Oratosquilla oratoria]|uniref:facilitated trehalose transporter Tret1-like n=1 Tax=Oratosquilla oratoria TaxID=337810 RepID=UPI003F760063